MLTSARRIPPFDQFARGATGATGTTGAAGPTGTAAVGFGLAEFVQQLQAPNTAVPIAGAFDFNGTAPVLDTTAGAVTRVPGPAPARGGFLGDAFTLAPGDYILDYEMSVAGAHSFTVYAGTTLAAMQATPDLFGTAGSADAGPGWTHGRHFLRAGAAGLFVMISPLVAPITVVLAGNSTTFTARLTIAKVG